MSLKDFLYHVNWDGKIHHKRGQHHSMNTQTLNLQREERCTVQTFQNLSKSTRICLSLSEMEMLLYTFKPSPCCALPILNSFPWPYSCTHLENTVWLLCAGAQCGVPGEEGRLHFWLLPPCLPFAGFLSPSCVFISTASVLPPMSSVEAHLLFKLYPVTILLK